MIITIPTKARRCYEIKVHAWRYLLRQPVSRRWLADIDAVTNQVLACMDAAREYVPAGEMDRDLTDLDTFVLRRAQLLGALAEMGVDLDP